MFKDQEQVTQMLLKEHANALSLLKRQLHSAQQALQDRQGRGSMSQANVKDTTSRLEKKVDLMSSSLNWNLSQSITERSMEFESMRVQARETYDSVSFALRYLARAALGLIPAAS